MPDKAQVDLEKFENELRKAAGLPPLPGTEDENENDPTVKAARKAAHLEEKKKVSRS
ncbi:MAG: hypothetical protein AAGU75_16145 [Bacillota bacterium]